MFGVYGLVILACVGLLGVLGGVVLPIIVKNLKK